MNKRGYITIAVIVLAAAAAVAYFGFLRPAAGDKPTVSAKGKVIVALDAGHGGTDPGAISGDYNEKVVNLAVAKKVQALLASDKQITILLTRSTDLLVPLEERIRIAQDGGASLYVSVHVDSYATPEVSGVGTWVDLTRKESESDATYQLARRLVDAAVTATGARNRGIQKQDSYLQRTTMPAVTLEVGFITNPTERALLFDPAYQDKLAAGIVAGIRDFLAWREAFQSASSAPASTSTTKTTTPAATSTPKKQP